MVGHANTPKGCFYCGHALNEASATTLVCPACGMAEFVKPSAQPQQQQQQQPQPKNKEPKD